MKKILLLLMLVALLNLQGAILFVLNSTSETVSRIDTETGDVNNGFASLGSMPNRLACSSRYIYVVNSGDNNVGKIDIENGQILDNIFLETSANPYDLIIHGDYLYTTGTLTGKVYKIDLITDSLVDQINVGSNPAGLTVWQNKLYVGNTDYMGNYGNCSVSVIDLVSFSVIETIPAAVNPQFLISDDDYVYVSCAGNWSSISGLIQVIDPVEDSMIQNISLNGICGDMAIYGNTVYVGDASNTGLYAFVKDTWEMIYYADCPFMPGGSIVEADEDNIAVCGGDWGSNFDVWIYDQDLEMIDQFQAGITSTDMKFSPETVNNDQNLAISVSQVEVYPNPFNPETTIHFSGSDYAEETELKIYNMKGQQIRQWKINDEKRSVVWNGEDGKGNRVSSGVYYINLFVNGKMKAAQKCLLLK